jgi:hypothetical protein
MNDKKEKALMTLIQNGILLVILLMVMLAVGSVVYEKQIATNCLECVTTSVGVPVGGVPVGCVVIQ